MPRSLRGSHDAIVVSAIGLLHAWIARDHRLYEVAAALEVSHGFLEGLFKASVGLDLRTYRTFIRIERARALLACPALPIGAVAQLSGFQRHAYFAKVFRDSCSMTPTEYRAGILAQAEPGRCPVRNGHGCLAGAVQVDGLPGRGSTKRRAAECGRARGAAAAERLPAAAAPHVDGP
jgi:AraC-like DNA-binding protein